MTKDTDNLDNISFVQYLHRKVLEEAEEAMTLDLPGDDQEALPAEAELSPEQKQNKIKKKNIIKRRMRMWLKNPLLWVFREIVDTELKIDKQRPATNTPPPMDEKDAELVQHFLDKQ